MVGSQGLGGADFWRLVFELLRSVIILHCLGFVQWLHLVCCCWRLNLLQQVLFYLSQILLFVVGELYFFLH